MRLQILCLLILTCLFTFTSIGLAETLKSNHFILESAPSNSHSLNQAVLRKSEYYYDKITRRLGFSKYKNYWTWDDRVKITLYGSKESFLKQTNLPEWSIGGATFGRHFSVDRSIVSFSQQDGFIDGILPHEIAHLVLRDFIGYTRTIPLWFDEGVAQLFERDKKTKAQQMMHSWVKSNKPIPFSIMMNYDIRLETDPLKVSVYYAQCVTMIDYLISIYGSTRFGDLCKFVKEGVRFEKAFMRAYKNIFDSIEEFEKKWLSYMKTSSTVVY